MKKFILLIFSLLNFLICKGQSDFVILKSKKIVDELIQIYKVLPELSSVTELSKEELSLTERIMKQSIETYNNKIQSEFKQRNEKQKYAELYKIMKLKNYKIQYVPYINESGEKEVWINGFCDDFEEDWRREIIYVFDGGNCYFTIKLNISNAECLEIGTNGYS